MAQVSQAQMLKTIDLLVQQGRAEHVIINGTPGIRMIEKPVPRAVDGEEAAGKERS